MYRFRYLVFVFLAFFINCKIEADEYSKSVQTGSLIYALTQIINFESITPDDNQVAYINAALAAWDISLEQNVFGATRQRGDNGVTHSPRHWIAATDSDCKGFGVDGFITGTCLLITNETFGFCEYRKDESSGELLDSTIVVYKGTPKDHIIRTFTHEIGHCMGLKHNSIKESIMHQSNTTILEPSTQDLEAIKDAYIPEPKEPSTSHAANYYFSTDSGKTVRQFIKPAFTISGKLGNAFTEYTEPPARTPITGNFNTYRHFYKENGDCFTEKLIQAKK